MSKVNFYLKDAQTKSTTLIYLYFSYDGIRFKYSTGESIAPKHWSDQTKRVKKTFEGAAELNNYLDKLGETVSDIYRQSKSLNRSTTPESLKAELKLINRPNRVIQTNLFSFIEEFIASCKSTRRPNTLRNYQQTLNVLTEYKEHKRKRLTFESIDLNFYTDFTDFLTLTKKHSNNTVGSHIKTLKTFLNEAVERELTEKIDFKNKRFKTISEDADNIYLTQSEIEYLYKFDLSKKEKLCRTRDLFVVACFTGLRFSDFSQIKIGNITNRNTIKIRTQKTDEQIEVPIHFIVKEIMEKYKNQYSNSLPPAYAQAVMNRYLKELGEYVGFESNIATKQTKAGLIVHTNRKKFELITTHTGRRSFATNLYLAKFPTITIMKITGHRTEKAFMKYIKVTNEQHAQLLADFWNTQNNRLKAV